MRIYVAMAHYDPRGEVAPHVRRNIEALALIAERLVVVTTARLTDESARWISERATLQVRDNFGYDFFSYRAGLLADGSLDALADYDRVIICNDTFVGPVSGYERVLREMEDRPYDVWGFTASDRIRRHIQSFFVCFMPWVVQSHAFTQFWLRMTPISDRWQVIMNYEIGLTRTLDDAGFSIGSYFVENERDTRAGQLRMSWQSWLRGRDMPARTRWRRLRHIDRDWNPCAAMADRVLDDARMPIVKIDTLRYDPYGLDSDRLLTACEHRYPDAFEGVREYLEQTSTFYPGRPGDRVPPPSSVTRPLRRLVHYTAGMP